MFWNNWLFLALLAPFIWALVNIIDAYFVKDIYSDEYDGTIISGIFQLILWLAIPIIGISWSNTTGILLAIAGGFLAIASAFFYFRALFIRADAALVLIIWSLVGVVVPGIEALLGERLGLIQYVGICVVFAGAIALVFNGEIRRGKLGKVVIEMLWAVFLCSGSMIVEKKAFQLINFRDGLLFIALGAGLAGLFFWLIRPKKGKSGHIRLAKKYFGIFIGAETLALAGVIVFERAIAVGPVSLVSAIGNVQPGWIMVISLAIYFVAKSCNFSKSESIQALYHDQIVGWPVKLLAIIAMAVGIYLIQ